MISIANIKYSKMSHFNNFTLEFLYGGYHRSSQLFYNKLSCECILNQIKAQNNGVMKILLYPSTFSCLITRHKLQRLSFSPKIF